MRTHKYLTHLTTQLLIIALLVLLFLFLCRPVQGGGEPQAAPHSSLVWDSSPVCQTKGAVIVDETGNLTTNETQMLLRVLGEFKARHDITLGLIFLRDTSSEEGQAKAKSYRQQMVENGALPQNSAIIAFPDKNSYVWQCDSRVMQKVSFEQIRYAWNLVGTPDRLAEMARLLLSHLSQLLGAKEPIKGDAIPPDVLPPPPPTAPTPPSDGGVRPPGTQKALLPPLLVAGDIIADKRIGPEGGSIAAPGQVTVDFPPGALKADERIVIRRAQGQNSNAQFVFIERDGGSALLAHPARVRFTLPVKLQNGGVVAAQEIGGSMYMVCPSSYDAKTRILDIEVTHFSGVGWFNKENCIKAAGGAITAIGTCFVIVGVAGTAILTAEVGVGVAAAKAVIFVAGAVGAAAANPVYDYYQRMGLDGVLTLGVQPHATDWVIRWKSSDYHSDPLITTVALSSGGRVLTAVPGHYSKDQLFAALSRQGLKSANVAVQMENVQVVPRKIFVLAWALLQAKNYYRQNGYNPPGTVEVLVDDNLSKSKSNEIHLGEWDEKFLRVHSNLVTGLAPDGGALLEGKRDELLATVAHEYWHVIFFAHGYKATCAFSWLDESMATTLESEVGPGYQKSFEMYQAATIAPQFERGLLAFSDQYCAWPLCKYLLHQKGGAYLTNVGLGKFDAVAWGGVEGVFANFVRSLLISESALPDTFTTTNGKIQSGWSKIEPSDWATGQVGKDSKGQLSLGVNNVTPLPALSYALRRVSLSSAPTTEKKPPAPLIIRRQSPDAYEVLIALKPQFAGGGQPRIGSRRFLAEVRQGVGGVAVPGEWLDHPTNIVPVGLVNTTAQASNPTPLYVYQLLPPIRLTLTPAGTNITLRWQLPELGTGLKLADALHGYRVFYKKKDEQPVMLPDLLIKPDVAAVTLLESAMPGAVAVGLASEDSTLRDEHGELLRSSIVWPQSAVGVVKVRVTEPRPATLDGYNPMDVLSGKPVPKAQVTCDYVEGGRSVHREAITNTRGECQFTDIPLGVDVIIGAQGLSRHVACTSATPQVMATFGWQGHEPGQP